MHVKFLAQFMTQMCWKINYYSITQKSQWVPLLFMFLLLFNTVSFTGFTNSKQNKTVLLSTSKSVSLAFLSQLLNLNTCPSVSIHIAGFLFYFDLLSKFLIQQPFQYPSNTCILELIPQKPTQFLKFCCWYFMFYLASGIL